MPEREHILSKVRAAIGRHIEQPPLPAPPPRLVLPEMSWQERVEALLANFSGNSLRAGSPEEARNHVASIVNGRAAVASGADLLRELGVTALPGVASGISDAKQLREAAGLAEVGVTGADYALADPGALVMLSSAREDRLVSLLPTVHIAVISVDQVLTGLDELFSIMPDPAEVSSSMVLIAGPSRSGDIEMKLTLGVHGPREIHLVIV